MKGYIYTELNMLENAALGIKKKSLLKRGRSEVT